MADCTNATFVSRSVSPCVPEAFALSTPLCLLCPSCLALLVNFFFFNYFKEQSPFKKTPKSLPPFFPRYVRINFPTPLFKTHQEYLTCSLPCSPLVRVAREGSSFPFCFTFFSFTPTQ